MLYGAQYHYSPFLFVVHLIMKNKNVGDKNFQPINETRLGSNWVTFVRMYGGISIELSQR
jgi:hypothetical protein